MYKYLIMEHNMSIIESFQQTFGYQNVCKNNHFKKTLKMFCFTDWSSDIIIDKKDSNL